MEKNKNKGSLILNIVLFLLLLCMSGVIVYDKIFMDNSKTTGDCALNGDKEEQKDIIRETQVISDKFGSFVLTKSGDVYYIPNQDGCYFNGDSCVPLVFKNSDVLGIKKKYIFDEYRVGPVNEFEAYKLDLYNILSVNSIYFGNGGFGLKQNYIFISNDGYISDLLFVINNDDTISVKFEKNISDYKNIVSVVPTSSFGGHSANLIDKDGNQYRYHGIRFED